MDTTFGVAKKSLKKFRLLREFFKAFFFATAKVASITAMIFFHVITLILRPMIALAGGGGGTPI